MQPLLSIIVALALVIALTIPAYAALNSRLRQTLSSRDLSSPAYYPIYNKIAPNITSPTANVSGEVSFSALDAVSKDAAKMTIGSCARLVVTATTPSGVERTYAGGPWGHCVYSMKVPADVPVIMNVEIARALGTPPAPSYRPGYAEWKIKLESSDIVQYKFKEPAVIYKELPVGYNYVASNQIKLMPGANVHIPFSAFEWLK
jgi:hypothetical protein